MSYTVKLDHFLSQAELSELLSECMPSLLVLNERYTKHVDPVSAFPVTPVYLDALRASWRLDSSADRPAEPIAIDGLGFAFGLLLAVCTDLRWAKAGDESGLFVTMAKVGDDPEFISVPPFSYVAKRRDIDSAEVFQHFFEQVPASVIGFRQPENWLLNGDV